MILMDMKTYKLLEGETNPPTDFCNPGSARFIELDDPIADAIAVLNRKGYRTAFCCSGHAGTRYMPVVAYIQYEFGCITPEHLPAGWEYIKDGHMEYVYTSFGVALEGEIAANMKSLATWAKELPDTTV